MMGIGLVVANMWQRWRNTPLATVVENPMVGGSSMSIPLDGSSFAMVCRCFLDLGCNGYNCG